MRLVLRSQEPVVFKIAQVQDPDTGEVRGCALNLTWAHRREQKPYRRSDFAWPAEAVIKGIERIRDGEGHDSDFPYFQVNDPSYTPAEPTKILGVWGTGSGVAGRYNANSDIDVWVQMSGLTHQGEKYVDQDVIEHLRQEGYNEESGEFIDEHDAGMGYAGGRKREIDAIVVDYPPGTTMGMEGFCTYDLLKDRRDVRESVESFNENRS